MITHQPQAHTSVNAGLLQMSLKTSAWDVHAACVPAKSLQSCLTLWDPMDYSPPGSSVHGILQAGILEWVAISYSRGSSQPRGQTCVSCMGRQILYHEPLGKPVLHLVGARNLMMDTMVNFRMKMQCPGLPSIQWTKSSLLSCCLVIQSCPTFWKLDPMDSLGFHGL